MPKHKFLLKAGFFIVIAAFFIFLDLPVFAGGFGQPATFEELEQGSESNNNPTRDVFDKIFVPSEPRTPIDPPTDDDDDEDEDDDNGDGEEEINQVVEIVLNQSLLDTMTQDILPIVADELGLNGVQEPDDIKKETDVGACHVGGMLKVYDIKIHLPISDDTFTANFASDSKLKTSWDFSEDSYFTAKLKLNVPRTPVGGDCTVIQWLLLGDLFITGDISVSGIKIDADFALGVKNNKVQVKTVSTFEADFDDVNVEIDDLEGGGIIKLLIDAGVGISTDDFSCDANSSFEECLETWAQNEIIKSIEGEDIKLSLKDAVNTAFGKALAIEKNIAIAGQPISYSFKLTDIENTPDNSSLITKWSVALTNNGSNDSCASDLEFSKDMVDVTTYDDQGSVDTYLPFWLIEQISYFIGKWGYFCAENSNSTSYEGVELAYQVSVKPAGEISLDTGTSFNISNGINMSRGIGSVLAQNQPLTNQTAPTISTNNIMNPGRLTVTPGTAIGAHSQDESSVSLSVPINLTFTGNISGTATATLKVKEQIESNDSQGISMKILSATIENASGSLTISAAGGRIEETVDINDADVLSELNTALSGGLDELNVQLIPQIMDLSESFGLKLSIDDLSFIDRAALKISLKLSAD